MAAARKELLDRLYQRLSTALDQLLRAIGLKSSPHNENKVLPITAYAFSQTRLRKSGPCGAV